jgi:ubiquinone/menaquinone biosynthesis C-methylase UbiE
MHKKDYVHGYSDTEANRLSDQANTLSELLHSDSVFPPGSKILEAGCGTGAQTKILTGKNPDCFFTSIDVSDESLSAAKKFVKNKNVAFMKADIFNLPFENESFDHVLVCFVLEHLDKPAEVLKSLKKVLKPGGTITVIEGDHGSAYFHPDSAEAHAAIKCLIDIQAKLKGNSLIGREIYPLLTSAGFKDCRVSPRMVYVDASKPGLVDGFIKKTFTAMVEGVKEQALSMNLIDPETWEKGIKALYRTAEPDGTFCYTFFKGIGIR